MIITEGINRHDWLGKVNHRKLCKKLNICHANKWHIYLPNPSPRAGCDTVFKAEFNRLKSEFSFSKTGFHTKVKVPSLPYYLPLTGGRIVGFIPSPWILVRCEIQTDSSRIWTQVTVSIFYDGNHYTTGDPPTNNKCYMLKPESIFENEIHKILGVLKIKQMTQLRSHDQS